jgi:3-hydroxyisobutyrate dehydrogenase-like beta-hydroxyacid dehydrogenase
MAKPVIAVIAPGAMGAAVGARLAEKGADVITSLGGRSAASAERAKKAQMRAVSDAQIPDAAIILSIVPPSDALGLAQRLAPVLRAAVHKPLYVDCNAVSPETAKAVAAVIAETGCPFADGGIIGGPPRAGYNGPNLYISGVPASSVAVLSGHGLSVPVIDGPVGAASALKMSYAAITKGLTALGSVSILASSRAGAADALRRELADSQPQLLAFLSRSVPDMFVKAYRFVGEMEEISSFATSDAGRDIYQGIADLYRQLADDASGDKRDIGTLAEFFTLESGKRRAAE